MSASLKTTFANLSKIDEVWFFSCNPKQEESLSSLVRTRKSSNVEKRRRMFTLVKQKFKSITVMPSDLDGVNFRTLMWGHHNQNINGEKMLQHIDMKGGSAGIEIPFICFHGKFFTSFFKYGFWIQSVTSHHNSLWFIVTLTSFSQKNLKKSKRNPKSHLVQKSRV